MNNGYSHPQGGLVEEQAGISWDGTSWRVTDSTLITEIARDQQRFVSHPLSPESKQEQQLQSLLLEQGIFLDGERHQVIRKVLDHALVQMLGPGSPHLEMIRATCTSMVKEVKPQGSMDLVERATWLTDTILSEMTGIPLASQEMQEGADAVADWTSGHRTASTLGQIERFKERLLPLIATRRQEVGQEQPTDLLGFVLEERALSPELVLANVLMCAAAGRHATRNTLTEGVWRLLQEGDLWMRLQEAVLLDVRVLHPLVERLLCLVTPTTVLARWAKEPIVLGGNQIEPGHKLVLDLWAANRAVCPHLDQEREALLRPLPRPHLSFGAPGDPHFCVGARLSREILRHALLVLLIALPHLRLQTSEEPVRSANTTIGGILTLPVCWQTTKEREDVIVS